jgi:NHL repeat.
MKASFGIILTALFSWFILHACISQEQQEEVLQNSEPQSVDVTVNVGGDSRAERFLGTFDQISRLSLDIDRNYGNKRVLTDFPLEHDGSKWTGTINKLIVGFDYTITGHAFMCTIFCNDYAISNFAGKVDSYGSGNGIGSNASFNGPNGIVIDSYGNIYIADVFNHLIRKIDPFGNVSTVAGQSRIAGHLDGNGTETLFYWPRGITINSSRDFIRC